jgi:hypothetical protein
MTPSDSSRNILSRLRKIESRKVASSGSGDPQGLPPRVKDSFREFWEMTVAWAAFRLQRGLDPGFTLDEHDAFVSPVLGRLAVSRDRMNLQELFKPLSEELPRERWDRFLAADDEAARAHERLLELADTCSVPDDYLPKMFRHAYTEEETEVFAGSPHRATAIFTDNKEREDTRRLAWLLIHDPDARELLREITNRRDAFLREEGSMPDGY